MNIISAANPRWANAEQTLINLDVETDKFGIIPFTASSNDSEKYGRDLFARAVAGDFGPIAGRSVNLIKAEKLAALDAERKRLETLPIAGNQGGKTFNISRPEKINEFLMGGLSIALDPSPNASFTMLDDNGVEVTYDKTLMGQIIKFISNGKSPALKRYDARKAAIEAAKDAADLARVDTDLTKP